ncbi:MAG: cobalamin biosynthesis protein, partial [Candidatus Odinarchaeota archaeon]
LDKNKTESMNAGWTMSTMAGLLNIQLEKKNYYNLGNDTRELVPLDIILSYKVIKNTILLFALTFLILTTFFILILIFISQLYLHQI